MIDDPWTRRIPRKLKKRRKKALAEFQKFAREVGVSMISTDDIIKRLEKLWNNPDLDYLPMGIVQGDKLIGIGHLESISIVPE